MFRLALKDLIICCDSLKRKLFDVAISLKRVCEMAVSVLLHDTAAHYYNPSKTKYVEQKGCCNLNYCRHVCQCLQCAGMRCVRV
jgi:hypothetical protein